VAPPKARAHILPKPELNPLVNPLLGDNMGRWAEVYFTAAPEKREEAVEELIRELEAGGSPEGEGKAPPAPTLANRPTADPEFRTPESARPGHTAGHQPEPGIAHCYACGHDNPATHQFCGMCGEKFFANGSEGPAGSAEPAERDAENPAFDARPYSRPLGGQAVAQRMEREPAPLLHYDQPLCEPDELSSLRRISGRNPEGVADFHFSLEPSSSRPHRVYLGAALVVGLLAVVYIWGHGSEALKSARRQVSPPPPPVTASEPAPAPATAASVVRPASTPSPTEPRAAVATAASAGTHTEPPVQQRAVEPSAKTTPGDNPAVSVGNGREELAMAQRYLSEGTGVQRNPAEAAQWLWKSIAKHNSEATLVLADLYLKGDGVPQNCDQARVLLDSAARKGITGAAERLRNLRAFGCQ
jgi:hypothetical protein